MLAEYGKLSLKDILDPAIEMADGYAIDAETANTIERQKTWLKKWKYSSAVMLPHPGEQREGPRAGEIFRQTDLAATLRKLVEAEQNRRATTPTPKVMLCDPGHPAEIEEPLHGWVCEDCAEWRDLLGTA